MTNNNNNNAIDFALHISNNNNNDNDFEEQYAQLPYYDDDSIILQDFTPLEPLNYQRYDVDRTAETTSNNSNAVETDWNSKRKYGNIIDDWNSIKKQKDMFGEAFQNKEQIEQEVEELVLSNQNMEGQLRNAVWLSISYNMSLPLNGVNWQLVDNNLEAYYEKMQQIYVDSEARRASDGDLHEKIEEKRKQEQLQVILNEAWEHYRPSLQGILRGFDGHLQQEAARMNGLLEFERMRALAFPQ